MRNRYVAGHITAPEQNLVSTSREQGRVPTLESQVPIMTEGEFDDIKFDDIKWPPP